MHFLTKTVFLFLTTIALYNISVGQVYFKQNGSGTKDGSNWDNARPASDFTTIANATSSVKLYLAQGTYQVTGTIVISNRDFYIKGGYPASATGTDTSTYNHLLNRSILTALNINNRKFNINGTSTGSTTVYFQGLEITQFSSSTTNGGVFLVSGGTGALSLSLIEVNAYSNSATNGGVLYLTSITGANKSLKIDLSTFSNNKATLSGAGSGGVMYLTTVYQTSPGNSGGNRGGEGNTPPFSITGSTFRNNSADFWGGAILLTTVSDLSIQNNYFCLSDLVTGGGGIGGSARNGGFLTWTTTNRVSAKDNIFTNGRVVQTGSAIYTETVNTPGNIIESNTFYNNNKETTSAEPDIYLQTPAMQLSIISNKFDKTGQTFWLSNPVPGGSITISDNTSNNTNFNPSCPSEIPIPLPVGLKSFDVFKSGTAVQLKWTTTFEINNQKFLLERSNDGLNFEILGSINSQATNGISENDITYHYSDLAPLKGLNYYRLKQIDFDGNYKYSPVRLVQYEETPLISVYPNPAKSSITIKGLSGEETIQLYDYAGRELKKIVNNGASALIHISLADIQEGIYFIRLTLPDGMFTTHKIVKTK